MDYNITSIVDSWSVRCMKEGTNVASTFVIDESGLSFITSDNLNGFIVSEGAVPNLLKGVWEFDASPIIPEAKDNNSPTPLRQVVRLIDDSEKGMTLQKAYDNYDTEPDGQLNGFTGTTPTEFRVGNAVLKLNQGNLTISLRDELNDYVTSGIDLTDGVISLYGNVRVPDTIETSHPNSAVNLTKLFYELESLLMSDNTWTKNNVFKNGLQSEKDPELDADVANKKYVDTKILSDIASSIIPLKTDLDTFEAQAHTWSSENAFTGPVTVTEPTNDDNPTNKGYVDRIDSELSKDIERVEQESKGRDELINEALDDLKDDVDTFETQAHSWSGANTFNGKTKVSLDPSDGVDVANKKYVDSVAATRSPWQGTLNLSASDTTTLPIYTDVYKSYQWRIGTGSIVVNGVTYANGDLVIANEDIKGNEAKPVSKFSFFNGQDADVVKTTESQTVSNKTITNTNLSATDNVYREATPTQDGTVVLAEVVESGNGGVVTSDLLANQWYVDKTTRENINALKAFGDGLLVGSVKLVGSMDGSSWTPNYYGYHLKTSDVGQGSILGPTFGPLRVDRYLSGTDSVGSLIFPDVTGEETIATVKNISDIFVSDNTWTGVQTIVGDLHINTPEGGLPTPPAIVLNSGSGSFRLTLPNGKNGTFALKEDVVSLSGAETITGKKTFLTGSSTENTGGGLLVGRLAEDGSEGLWALDGSGLRLEARSGMGGVTTIGLDLISSESIRGRYLTGSFIRGLSTLADGTAGGLISVPYLPADTPVGQETLALKSDITAADANVVHKDGSESIAGIKSFLKGINIGSPANQFGNPDWRLESGGITYFGGSMSMPGNTKILPQVVSSDVVSARAVKGLTSSSGEIIIPEKAGTFALKDDVEAADKANADAIATKANDTDVVHKDGIETINGGKFFEDIFVRNIWLSDQFDGSFGSIFFSEGASHGNLTGSLSVLPLGTTTALGAPAYGLHVSATGGLQLFGTHFLQGTIWDDIPSGGLTRGLKVVANNISLYSTNEAAIGFDYANTVVFRTMPNDGTEATYKLEAWQWDDDSHTTKSPSAGVKLLKSSQKTALEPDSVLNMQEGDARWGKYENPSWVLTYAYGSEITPVYFSFDAESTGGDFGFRYEQGGSSYKLVFPQGSGTIALTSDIPDVSSFLSGSSYKGYFRPNNVMFIPSLIIESAIYVGDEEFECLFQKKNGTVALLDDISEADKNVVHLSGDETIAGVKVFNDGIKVSSIASLSGTPIYDTSDGRGFNFKGIYTLRGYVSGGANATSVPFFKQETPTTNWIDVTTLKESGVAISEKYASSEKVYTKAEIDGVDTGADTVIKMNEIHSQLKDWEEVAGVDLPLDFWEQLMEEFQQWQENPTFKNWNTTSETESNNPFNSSATSKPIIAWDLECKGLVSYPSFSADILGLVFLSGVGSAYCAMVKSKNSSFVYCDSEDCFGLVRNSSGSPILYLPNATIISQISAYSGTPTVYAPKAKNFRQAFYNNSRYNIAVALPAGEDGLGAFSSTAMSAENISATLDSLPTWTDGAEHVITFTGSPGAAELTQESPSVANAIAKGWTVEL